MSPAEGFVFVDKPAGCTSHDVVAAVRRAFGLRRVGHAGTLDPMATGVLIIGVGRVTRLLGYIAGGDKTYEATIQLGTSTLTDDSQGEVLAQRDAGAITEEHVVRAMAQFIGRIQQRPSAVSAIKIEGKRAYARVRAGEEVELPARTVVVYSFELLAWRPGPAAELDVRVHCSSGTYIRALARDIGTDLGVGAHLRALRRTASGSVTVTRCITLAQVAESDGPIPISDVVGEWFGTVSVTADVAAAMGHGRRMPVPDVPHLDPSQSVAVVGSHGDVVGLARIEDGMLVPTVVLAPAAT